jgi:tRNA wybutosine-synthesizing protein 4
VFSNKQSLTTSGLVLLTAEVSITYMDVQSADALIQWASKLPEARFCLLEQLLPNGIDHPFAKTMMAHFDKLQTPINAVQRYSTCIAQQQRFESLGWSKVAVRNLWELWSASEFLTSAERRVLEKIEPFDEWEEFALFGCHYFLLVADTGGSNVASPHFLANQGIEARTSTTINDGNYTDLQATFTQYPKLQGRRRFAAAMPLTGPDRSILRFGVFGGMGLVTRMNSYDEYTSDSIETQQTRGPLINPCSRMGHTITDIGNVGALLVGGRTSPDNALKDCWLYHKWLNTWEPVDDLLYPLYRYVFLLCCLVYFCLVVVYM